MSHSLTVVGLRPSSGVCPELVFDGTVPMQLSISSSSAQVGYLTLGQFPESLLELAIECGTQVLCGVTLVAAEALLQQPVVDVTFVKSGIPVLSTAFESYAVMEVGLGFDVALGQDHLLIYWDDLQQCEGYQLDERVGFLSRRGRLAGVLISGITSEERRNFVRACSVGAGT